MLFFTPYDFLLIPGLLFAMWAQYKVSSAYRKYSQVGTRAGLTGAQVAEMILRDAEVRVGGGGRAVSGIEAIAGQMTDHYDPSARALRLSQDVYHGQSIAALGIAAHEVGHAIQHANRYAPLLLRGYIYPACSFGEFLSFPLLFGGLFMGMPALVTAGILLFTIAVAFTIITLPVEFDASRRAILALERGGYMTQDELAGARKVLNAAALTYVAAAVSAILSLVRLLLISRNSD